MPKLGNYLGDLTDELTCKNLKCKNNRCGGHWIEEFVSCGPKNYSYKLNSGEVVCKVRGFSLSHKTSLIVNFSSMKEALDAYLKKISDGPKLITVRTEIQRSKHEQIVYSKEVEKQYGVVYDKRRIVNNYKTVPFGYRRK